MFLRKKALFLILVMTIGLIGGAPLNAADNGAGSMTDCPMKCCKESIKAKDKEQSSSKSFCIITDCRETAPAAPASLTFNNIAPAISKRLTSSSLETVHAIVIPQISSRPGKPDLVNPPPFFLLHNSFLI